MKPLLITLILLVVLVAGCTQFSSKPSYYCDEKNITHCNNLLSNCTDSIVTRKMNHQSYGKYIVSVDASKEGDTCRMIYNVTWAVYFKLENNSMVCRLPLSKGLVDFTQQAFESNCEGSYKDKMFMPPSEPITLVGSTNGQEKFRLDIKVDSLTRTVMPGGNFKYQVILYGMNLAKSVDIPINYTVKSVETDDVIAKSGEIVAVEKSMAFVREITIPVYAEPGVYTIEAKATYNNSLAASVSSFNVFIV